ncbi:MAG: hypothetical protein QM741_14990 [Rudaea sp.]
MVKHRVVCQRFDRGHAYKGRELQIVDAEFVPMALEIGPEQDVVLAVEGCQLYRQKNTSFAGAGLRSIGSSSISFNHTELATALQPRSPEQLDVFHPHMPSSNRAMASGDGN